MLIAYTAIFGDTEDELQQLPSFDEGVECHAFLGGVTTPRIDKTGWVLQPPVFFHPDNRRRARMHKVLAHQLFPDASRTLWLDGCLTPRIDPALLAKTYVKRHDFCTFRHGDRNCIYREAEACIQLEKDFPQVICAQMDRYRAAGFPRNCGLAETTALLRKHNTRTARFNEHWWSELSQGSVRDQLSFDYVMWSLEMSYNKFPGRPWNSGFFSWISHWT